MQDQDTAGGDPPGLAEQGGGVVGVSQHEREQARVEGAIGKGQPGADEEDGPVSDDVKIQHVRLDAGAARGIAEPPRCGRFLSRCQALSSPSEGEGRAGRPGARPGGGAGGGRRPAAARSWQELREQAGCSALFQQPVDHLSTRGR